MRAREARPIFTGSGTATTSMKSPSMSRLSRLRTVPSLTPTSLATRAFDVSSVMLKYLDDSQV